MSLKKITNCLWFDYGVGEKAVEHYTTIFTDSKIIGKNYYPESGQDVHGAEPGSVMSISFELQGHTFLALNGGPIFKPTPANSYMVMCKDQAEVDYFWEKLGEGGEYMPCGWLNDKFGVSWQIVPEKMSEMELTKDKKKMENLFDAMMPMKKLDLEALEAAFNKST